MTPEFRYNTARIYQLGPFLDASDGDTEMNSLTINISAVFLSKQGTSTYTAMGSGQSLTATGKAMYRTSFTASNVGTLGLMQYVCHPTSALVVFGDIMVVTQEYWDKKYGSGEFAVKLSTSGTQQVNNECSSVVGTYAPAQAGDEMDIDASAVAKVNAACDTALSDYAPAIAGDEMDINASAVAKVNAACDTALVDYDAAIPGDNMGLTSAATTAVTNAIEALASYKRTYGVNYGKYSYNATTKLLTIYDPDDADTPLFVWNLATANVRTSQAP